MFVEVPDFNYPLPYTEVQSIKTLVAAFDIRMPTPTLWLIVVSSRIYDEVFLSKLPPSLSIQCMCFTNSYCVNTSTGHFSPAPCNVPTSAQCPYVQFPNFAVFFRCTLGESLSSLFSSRTSSHASSLGNRHIAFKNRIGSVCGFSNNVYFTGEGYQPSARPKPNIEG